MRFICMHTSLQIEIFNTKNYLRNMLLSALRRGSTLRKTFYMAGLVQGFRRASAFRLSALVQHGNQEEIK